MSRKIFLIIVIILILIIGGALLYLFISPENILEPSLSPSPLIPVSDTTPTTTNVPAGVPEVAKVTQVIENQVLGFALTGNAMIYYDKDLGAFFKMNQRGLTPESYSTSHFSNVEEIIWSPDKSEAIMVFTSGDYYYFNIASSKSEKLMPNIDKLSWLPDGKKIVFEWRERENESSLIISEPNGDDWEKIKDLGYARIILTVSPELGGPVVYLQNYSYGAGRSIYPVYEDGSAGEVVNIEGYGEKAEWSRDGRRILFEAVDSEDFEQYLWVIDVTGTNQYNLGVKGFVEKCVWNKTNEKLFCAVPSEALEFGALVSDESIDNFWEINTKTGEKSKLYDESESDTKFDAHNLWLNSNEDRLYFADEAGGVYILRID